MRWIMLKQHLILNLFYHREAYTCLDIWPLGSIYLFGHFIIGKRILVWKLKGFFKMTTFKFCWITFLLLLYKHDSMVQLWGSLVITRFNGSALGSLVITSLILCNYIQFMNLCLRVWMCIHAYFIFIVQLSLCNWKIIEDLF